MTTMSKNLKLDALLESGDVRFNGMRYVERIETVSGRISWVLLGFEGEEENIERSLLPDDIVLKRRTILAKRG